MPWVADAVRYQPELAQRRGFFARCQAALEARGRPYVVLRGDWEARTRAAELAVERLLEGRP